MAEALDERLVAERAPGVSALPHGHGAQMHVVRHQAVGPDAAAGLAAHWAISDRYSQLPSEKNVCMRRLPRCVMWWGRPGATILTALAMA